MLKIKISIILNGTSIKIKNLLLARIQHMLDGIPIDKIGLPFFFGYITKYCKGEEKKK